MLRIGLILFIIVCGMAILASNTTELKMAYGCGKLEVKLEDYPEIKSSCEKYRKLWERNVEDGQENLH